MPDDAGFTRVETLRPGHTRRAIDSAGHAVILKSLDSACLQHGKLHPNVKERLARIRELPVRDVALLHGVEIVDGEAVLVWDYLEGVTLAEFAGRTAVPGLARELTLLLDAVHGHGLVHGAIHSRNFIFDAAGKPQLTHFSPLLHYDPALDRDHLATMLNDLGLAEPTPPHATAPLEPPVWRTALGSASLWLAVLLAMGAIAAGAWIYRTERPAVTPERGSTTSLNERR